MHRSAPLRADAIAVLGCRVRADGRPSAALARRIRLGARAFREGVAPRIVTSGGRRWHGHAEALVMARELGDAGVDAGAICLELCSLCTVDNGLFCAELLPAGATVMLATCGWHLPRAAAAFRRFGLRVTRPPQAWLDTPPPGWGERMREGLCHWADWAYMMVGPHDGGPTR